MIDFKEKNGVFIGISAGYTFNKITASTNITINNQTLTAAGNKKINVFIGGVLVGYKAFYNEHFGFRVYFNLDYSKPNFKDLAGYNKAFILNYVGSLDFLFNFYNKENINLGVFAGVNMEGNSILNLNKSLSGKEKNTDFGAGINLGLRSTLAQNHGLEIALKIPFYKHDMLQNTQFSGTSTSLYFKQNLNLKLHYIYTF